MNTGHKLLPKSGAWVNITQIIPTVYPVHRFGIYYAYPTGKYFWKGERERKYQFDQYEDEHPYTGESFYRLKRAFGTDDQIKVAIVNYKRNPHHDFTDEQLKALDSFGAETLEKEFPIEAQVKLVTEYGTIAIQPEEYTLVGEEKLQEYFAHVKDKHAFIVYLSRAKQLKGKVADQVFYLRTRGISFEKAIQLCIGEVKTSNLLYLYMHPGYVEHFTRQEPFEHYVNKHIHYMKDKGLEDQAAEYLSQVHTIEGFHDFKPKPIEGVEPVTANQSL